MTNGLGRPTTGGGFLWCVLGSIDSVSLQHLSSYDSMVTMGGDLQPGSLADRLLTGLGQPQINHKLRKKKKKSIVLLRKEIMNKLVVDLLQQKGLGC
jgi:hypothetical protein